MRLLLHGARDLGLCLTSAHLAAFQTYYEQLIAWNERFNLTAVTEYEDVQRKHFIDSLTCLLVLPGRGENGPSPDTVPLSSGREPNLRCIDVGTGAGFPGLPMRILRPDLDLTLLEATGKKTVFLQHIVDELDLGGVEIVHGRAEELAHRPGYREEYDVVVARAVAELPILVEYCLPLCRVGGRFIAPKIADVEHELSAARSAMETLGGRLREVKPVSLPGLVEKRCLVVIDKVARTPGDYPRRPGMPAKHPLQ